MKHDLHAQGMAELRERNRRKDWTIGALIGALLLALLSITQLIGASRTVIVPPTIERSFWVAHDRASHEYLEQMAAFAAWLILDANPVSVNWKKKTLLEHVAPQASGELKTRLDAESERLRSINGSTLFSPRSMTANEADQSVTLFGKLRTQVNGQTTSDLEKQYLAKFQFSGGRMSLKSFEEISNEDH